jgi:hypothetical protein
MYPRIEERSPVMDQWSKGKYLPDISAMGMQCGNENPTSLNKFYCSEYAQVLVLVPITSISKL